MPNCIYIFDQPRTCCMLFQRLLSQHPQLGHVFHPFSAAAMYGPERIQQYLKCSEEANGVQLDWGENYPDMNRTTYESSYTDLMKRVAEIEEQAKVVCVKDHVSCIIQQDLLASASFGSGEGKNPLRLPDSFLKAITHPILLIRHPLLMIRSFWSTQKQVYKLQPEDELFQVMTTLRYTSMLYDWLVVHGVQPTIVDGQDIVSHTQPLMEKLCKRLGNDPSGVVYEWEAESEVDWADIHMTRVFMGNLKRSTGVRKPEVGDVEVPELERQVAAWTQELGDERAQTLRRRVEEEMPLYQRLKAVALKI